MEITNLIIPDLNESQKDMEELSKWVVNNLGQNTPTHFSAYHPDFKAPSKIRTPHDALDRAYSIAKKAGLNYVYVGNLPHDKGSNTYCPNCNHLIIGRRGYSFTKIDITKDKKCPNCGYDFKKDIIGNISYEKKHDSSFF